MLYLLAILLPPVAVLICGKPIQALLNVLLTLAFWFPGAIHAVLVVKQKQDRENTDRIVAAVREGQRGP